jgi:hypothetical protein
MTHQNIIDKFKEQLGSSRFEEFSVQLRINLRTKYKLNFWHQREWNKFCDTHTECKDLSLEEVCEIFRTPEEKQQIPDSAHQGLLATVIFTPALEPDIRHSLEDQLLNNLAPTGWDVCGGGQSLDGSFSEIAIRHLSINASAEVIIDNLVLLEAPPNTKISVSDGSRTNVFAVHSS